MVNYERLMQIVNRNPRIDPWFIPHIKAILPAAFEVIGENLPEENILPYLEEKAAFLLERTEFVQVPTFQKGDSGKDTAGNWNAGFVDRNGYNYYSAFHGKDDFKGRISVLESLDDSEKVQVLIHELCGHLFSQNTDISDYMGKRFIIDGFSMRALDKDGFGCGALNRMSNEGAAEFISEKIGNRLAAQYGLYTIADSYRFPLKMTKLLQNTRYSNYLNCFFKGEPQKFEKMMDHVLRKDSWYAYNSQLDALCAMHKDKIHQYSDYRQVYSDPELTRQMEAAQRIPMLFFAENEKEYLKNNTSRVSLKEYYESIEKAESYLLVNNHDWKLERADLDWHYVCANMKHGFFEEKVQQCNALAIIRDLRNSTFSKEFAGVLSGKVFSLSMDKILEQIKKQKESFDLQMKSVYTKTSFKTTPALFKHKGDDCHLLSMNVSGKNRLFIVKHNEYDKKEGNYRTYSEFQDSPRYQEIELKEFDLQRTDMNPGEHDMKEALYKSYGPKNRLINLLHRKANRINTKLIPECYYHQDCPDLVFTKDADENLKVHQLNYKRGKPEITEVQWGQSQKVIGAEIQVFRENNSKADREIHQTTKKNRASRDQLQKRESLTR